MENKGLEAWISKDEPELFFGTDRDAYVVRFDESRPVEKISIFRRLYYGWVGFLQGWRNEL